MIFTSLVWDRNKIMIINAESKSVKCPSTCLLGHIEVAQGIQWLGEVWVKQTPNFIPAGHRVNRKDEQDSGWVAGRNPQDYEGDFLFLLSSMENLLLKSKGTHKHCLVYLGESQNLDNIVILFMHWGSYLMRTGITYKKTDKEQTVKPV